MKTKKRIDLINRIVDKLSPKYTKKDIKIIVNEVFDTITEYLEEGYRLEFRGFGIFNTKPRKEKTGVNPSTRKTIHIPARIVPVFKPAKNLKEKVNKKRSQ